MSQRNKNQVNKSLASSVFSNYPLKKEKSSVKIFPEKYSSKIDFGNKGKLKIIKLDKIYNNTYSKRIDPKDKMTNKILKDKYEFHSQIYGLPGSAKRKVEDEYLINNNHNKMHVSPIKSLNSAFCSKVACLPGSSERGNDIPIQSYRRMIQESRDKYYEKSKNICYDNNIKISSSYDRIFRNESGINKYKRVGYPMRNRLYYEQHYEIPTVPKTSYKNQSNFDF